MGKRGENMDENSRRLHKPTTQNKTPSHMSSKQSCGPLMEVKHSVFMLDPCSSDYLYFIFNGRFDPTVDWYCSNFEVFNLSKQKACGTCNYFGR